MARADLSDRIQITKPGHDTRLIPPPRLQEYLRSGWSAPTAPIPPRELEQLAVQVEAIQQVITVQFPAAVTASVEDRAELHAKVDAVGETAQAAAVQVAAVAPAVAKTSPRVDALIVRADTTDQAITALQGRPQVLPQNAPPALPGGAIVNVVATLTTVRDQLNTLRSRLVASHVLKDA